MKIAVTADLHLNNSTYGRTHNGLPLKTCDAIQALKFVVDKSIEEGVQHFVAAGDVYSTHCPGNAVRELVNEQFQRLLQKKIEVHLMTGNHDWSHDSHSLLPMKGWHPLLHVYDDFKVVKLGECTLLFLPHTKEVQRKERTFREYIVKISQKLSGVTFPRPIFFGHFGVSGAMQNDLCKNLCPEDPSVGDLIDIGAQRCFLGHYHKRQALDGNEHVWYVGSHERERFDERDQTKGFCIYNVEDDVIQWVDYEARPMTNILASSVEDVQAFAAANVLEGHVVRVHVQGNVSNYAALQKQYKDVTKILREAQVAHFIGLKKDTEVVQEAGELAVPDLGERVDVYKLIGDRITAQYEGKERDRLLTFLQTVKTDVNQQRREVGLSSQAKSVRFKWAKYHNFCAFGEEDNILDLDGIFGSGGADLGEVLLILGAIDGDENDANGAGKSSILEGIAYALYEKIPRLSVLKDRKRVTTVEIVRTNPDNTFACRESYVVLCLEVDDDEWIIKRGRKVSLRGNHTPILELSCNGKSWSSQQNKDPNEMIVEIVGIDYDSFCNCIFFAQKDTSRLFASTQKGKMDLFLMILGILPDMESALKLIRERASENRRRCAQIEGEVSAYEPAKDGVDYQKLFRKYLDEEEHEKERLVSILAERNVELDDLKVKVHAHRTDSEEKKVKIEALRKQIEEIKAKHEESTQSVRQRIVAIQKSINREKRRIADFKETETRLKERYKAEKKIVDGIDAGEQESIIRLADEAEKDLAYVEGALNQERILEKKAIQEKTEVLGNIRNIQTEIDKYQAELNATDAQIVKCPHCGAERPRPQLNEKISVLEADKSCEREKLERAKQCERDISVEIANLCSKKTELEAKIRLKSGAQLTIQRQQSAQKRMEETVAEARETVAKFKDAGTFDIEAEEDQIRQLDEQLIKSELSLNRQTKEFVESANDLESQVAKSVPEFLKLSEACTECQKIIDTTNEEKAAKDQSIGTLKARIIAYEETQAKLAGAKERLRECQTESNDIGVLDRLFGSDGVRTDISAMYLPVFNEHMGEFMAILTDGRIDVSIDPKTFTTTILGASAGIFEMLSGGEQDEVRLAGNLALGMLSLGSSKCLPDMLCLDEIFGALAPASQEKALDLLRHLRTFFKRILVITHNPDLKDRFDRRVRINKVEGISRLESA